ncbi:MAG: glycosyltransferase [Flavobacteriales bacterium]|nr:glycosyltransferase [Flavobacteriales bacterium]
MILVLIFFFSIYVSSLFLLLGIGLTKQWQKERSYLNSNDKIKLTDVAVIIPFRNEEKRIIDLLKSIQNSNKLPAQLIFVDDHSNDQTVQLINEHLTGINYQILTLPEQEFGKKRALRFGISTVSTAYFLTLDADVSFSKNYFESIEKLSQADLYLLPAVLISKRWYEHFFEVDLLLVNALNTGLSGLKRPIIASGANLLVRKQAFDAFDQFETHAHIPSGDDIYLLRDFRNANAEIRIFTQPELQVTTETPQSLSEFLHQRLRWIAKTGNVKDHLSTTLAAAQFVLTIAFFSLLVYLCSKSEFLFATIIYALKVGVDMLLFLPFFNRFKRVKAWLILPIYQVLFPFYNLLILVLLPFFTPIWKGRKSGVK